MSVIDDITALLTPVLHTNTTKDITAAAVKAALITAFTDIVADMDVKKAAIDAEVADIAAAVNVHNGIDLDSLEEDFGNTINIFNPAKITASSFMHSNGDIAGFGGNAVSDFMAVVPGGKIHCNHSESVWTTTDSGPCFYDADKNFVGHAPLMFDGINPIDVPAGAVYVRVNVPDSIRSDYMLVRGATLPDHFVPWGMTSSKRVIDIAIPAARNLSAFNELTGERVGQNSTPASFPTLLQNYHALPGYLVGTTFNTSNGNASSSAWDTTDYFPVPPGGEITIVGAHDDYSGIGGYGLTFWDDNRRFVSGISFAGGPPSGVVSVPSKAYFGRMTVVPGSNPDLSGSHDDKNSRTLAIVAGNQPLMNHKFKAIPSLVSMHRPWTNKVWACSGDSLSADGFSHWFRKAAQYHGCKYIKNTSVAGRFMYDFNKDAWHFPQSDCVTLPAGFYADVDCAMMLGGTNSIGFDHVAIGSITDTPGMAPGNTWFAMLRAWVEFALNDNPKMRIVLATVNQRGGITLAQMNAYNQAIKDVANYYAVRVWDCANQSQMSPLTWSGYAPDTVHPADDDYFSLVFGSNLAAFMHTVFPMDFVGDPLFGGPSYNNLPALIVAP